LQGGLGQAHIGAGLLESRLGIHKLLLADRLVPNQHTIALEQGLSLRLVRL